MGRIPGHYEWDGDDLRPGQKKEGGLHQNLFDSEGKLKGIARFIPDYGAGSERLVVTETVYVPIEERRCQQEDEEFKQAIANLVFVLIGHGIVAATPIAIRWWQNTAKPAIASKQAELLGKLGSVPGQDPQPANVRQWRERPRQRAVLHQLCDPLGVADVALRQGTAFTWATFSSHTPS